MVNSESGASYVSSNLQSVLSGEGMVLFASELVFDDIRLDLSQQASKTLCKLLKKVDFCQENKGRMEFSWKWTNKSGLIQVT